METIHAQPKECQLRPRVIIELLDDGALRILSVGGSDAQVDLILDALRKQSNGKA